LEAPHQLSGAKNLNPLKSDERKVLKIYQTQQRVCHEEFHNGSSNFLGLLVQKLFYLTFSGNFSQKTLKCVLLKQFKQ
jgi:hypothetical protein